jgi:hypothetical protein
MTTMTMDMIITTTTTTTAMIATTLRTKLNKDITTTMTMT